MTGKLFDLKILMLFTFRSAWSKRLIVVEMINHVYTNVSFDKLPFLNKC